MTGDGDTGDVGSGMLGISGDVMAIPARGMDAYLLTG